MIYINSRMAAEGRTKWGRGRSARDSGDQDHDDDCDDDDD